MNNMRNDCIDARILLQALKNRGDLLNYNAKELVTLYNMKF